MLQFPAYYKTHYIISYCVHYCITQNQLKLQAHMTKIHTHIIYKEL